MAMASSTNKTPPPPPSSSSSVNLNNSSTNSTPENPRHFLERPHPNPNSSPKLPIHVNPNSSISTSRALIPFTPNKLLLNPNQDSTKTIKNPNPDAVESTNPIANLTPDPNPNPNPSPSPSPNPSSNPKPGFNPITSSNPKPGNNDSVVKPAAEHHKKRSKNWSRSETLTLIRVRTELAPRFARSGRKSELWDEIAACLQKGHFARDAQQCRDKWEKLMAGYKEVRDGAKAPQDNPYYEELHPLLLISHHRKREKSDDDSATPSTTITTMSEKNHTNTTQGPAKTLALPTMAQPGHRSYKNPNPHPNLHHMDQYHQFKLVSRSFRAARSDRPGDDNYDNDEDYDDDRDLDHEEEEEEEEEDDDDDDGDVHEVGRPRKLRKAGGSTKARSSSSTIDLEGLLESAIARQQSFFRELLEGIEEKEVMREQRRQEREDKWRAEERAQRVVFTQAMHVLSQRLGLGVVPMQQWPLTTTTVPEPMPTPMGHPHVHMFAHTPPNPPDPTLLTTPDSDTPRLFPSPKRRSKNWKRAEVLHLIRLRGEMDERFSKSARRAALWTELAGTLASLGINRDGKQCREKWDKLMSEYKDVVDGKKERNDSPYFVDLQDALVGGRPREAG